VAITACNLKKKKKKSLDNFLMVGFVDFGGGIRFHARIFIDFSFIFFPRET
jgi:hypothetical protein